MRILWVKLGGLWPLDSGGRLRSFNLLRELSREHDVTVVTTREPRAPEGILHKELPDCRKIIEVSHRLVKHTDARFKFLLAKSWLSGRPVDIERSRVPALATEVEACLDTGGFDLCIADFLCALPNVPLNGPTPVLLFEHNVEYMIWKRLARTSKSWPRRLVLEGEWRRLRRFERLSCARVARTVAVSETDRDLLRSLSPEASVFAVPTGVDIQYFAPRPKVRERREVVFVGSMDWYPNEDAMRWFIEAVLPELRRRVPDVLVTVVGRNPSTAFSRDAQVHGVHVTGTVADVRDYVARAAVCIVPLRIGGGTRLKIFEGMAMGKATVTTTIGAEGLPLLDGRDAVFADQADDFAKGVADLLLDPGRRRELGEAGRERVASCYAWPRVAREFALLCQSSNAGSRSVGAGGGRDDLLCPHPEASSRRPGYSAPHVLDKGVRS